MRIFQLDSNLSTQLKLTLRVLEQRLGRNAPMFATYFITDRCNVRCHGCIYYENLEMESGDLELDTEKACLIMRRLGEGGVPIVQVAGGEPYLRKDLPEILKAGKEAGLALSVVTNAMMLTDSGLEAVERHCDWALFSPHVPEELAGHQGAANYEKGWAGFNRMCQALKRPKRTVAININKYTLPYLDEIFERAIAAGADAIKFQPNFVRDLFAGQKSLEEGLDTIRKWRTRYPNVVMATDRYLADFAHYFDPQPWVPCTSNRRFHLGVLADGSVSACCPERVIMGNLTKQPLREMLAHPLEVKPDCYGCHRLDVAMALRLAGNRF